MNCTEKLTQNIDGCLAEDQKRVSGIVLDVARTLLNFTCFKEGDRIACKWKRTLAMIKIRNAILI
jgi:Protein of unknown function (DUF1397)